MEEIYFLLVTVNGRCIRGTAKRTDLSAKLWNTGKNVFPGTYAPTVDPNNGPAPIDFGYLWDKY